MLRRLYVVLASVVVLCLPSQFSAHEKADDPKKDDKALLRELRDTLAKVIDARMDQLYVGGTNIDPVSQAVRGPVTQSVRSLARVSLELYEDRKERVAAIQGCVKIAKELLQVTTAKKGTEVDTLEARVLLLELQAELQRTEKRQEKEKPKQ